MDTLSAEHAAGRLHAGGVIAYPTEGVWGLGCDPLDEFAVMRLLAIKHRPPDKGLILIADALEPLRDFLDLTALPAERLSEVLASWPGPHTWILPASAKAPGWITGNHDGIAVRVSAHPAVVALCRAHGGALVSTSANLAGQPAPRRREALDPALLALVDGVLEGETGELVEATPIRDARSGARLRG
ncbi:tRNA threonylcarbamoyladenosine biosynthesis protein RimN [Pseudoxanthomonas kalamensis DSM 18571]|uniref:Sua5/YciO/YrdC/YwlC family protein n=1 Tax=Pseudoxanthomonas kalamensis TaxID=289483 RepID=UPI0013909F08|nr:Sua5/YciO/YrdC/YwlC family protein [Pseudoxanthomonas kalamensis]KAF1712514.1 tRNA threonylcarbamoyladenosine biosynthesis protein RimN [Pseudoxanthomonas kalamensis DSM 18571]